MLYSLSLLILCCAIIVMFSQEIIDLIKKIIALHGMKILLPLFLISFVSINYESWVIWILLWIRWGLAIAIYYIASILNFFSGLLFAKLLILVTLTITPVVIINFWTQRKSFSPFYHAFFTSMIIWLFLVCLIITS